MIDKKYLPLIIAAVIIVVGIGSVLVFSKKNSQSAGQGGTTQLPTTEVVPTVDSSVSVDLKPVDAAKHNVELSVKGIPSGTQSLEYELSYDTASQGSQGIIPDEPIAVKPGQTEFSKQFLLGTESSGAFTYHVVTSPIKVSVTFNGSYGKKSFEKDYTL